MDKKDNQLEVGRKVSLLNHYGDRSRKRMVAMKPRRNT